MSGGAFVSDQLAAIKHGRQVLPWAGDTIDVEYIKTSKYIYGRVLDIAKVMMGDKQNNIRSLVNGRIQKMKLKYGENLDDAVKKVCYQLSLTITALFVFDRH